MTPTSQAALGRLLAAALLLMVPLHPGCSCSGSGGSGGLPGPSRPRALPERTVAELVTPFDVHRRDLLGPNDHNAMYGMRPKIIAQPDGSSVDVLVQDEGVDLDMGERNRAVLLRLSPDAGGYAVTRALEVPLLDHIMGLARASDGDYFVASAIVESQHRELSRSYPGENQYRANVVHVARLSPDGTVRYEVDLDLAREATGDEPEKLINPMVASTARLEFGGGELALVHGINTDPDSNGTRHQKAITTVLRANDGAVLRTSSMWVSHSFDVRLFHHGGGFMELHLGDAYPRQLVFDRVSGTARSSAYPAYFIKGATGNNNTYTRLGGMAPITADPDFGYLVLFATERVTTEPDSGKVGGPRDLAMVRIRRDFADLDAGELAHLDATLPDVQDVSSGGTDRQNHVLFLTNHGATGDVHAERPKLLPLGGDTYLVLYERWEGDNSGSYEFTGVHALVIDADGTVLVASTDLGAVHLPRGDDAFVLGGGGAWVTGDEQERSLTLHHVTRTGDSVALVSSVIR
ncbi:MAG: hypothetical protein KC593_16945 [Myxococcales bacterium]|nr:hypothetical protein [Myxococcales bacterium]